MRLAASSRRMAVHGKCVRWVLIVLFCLVLGLVGPVRAQSSAEGKFNSSRQNFLIVATVCCWLYAHTLPLLFTYDTTFGQYISSGSIEYLIHIMPIIVLTTRWDQN